MENKTRVGAIVLLGLMASTTLLGRSGRSAMSSQAHAAHALPHAHVDHHAEHSVAHSTDKESPYTKLYPASADGIGKVYMGREISQVMGHLGAGWLERPGREAEEKPATLIENLGLEPGMTVADIGAGTGYFTFRLAEQVGQGQVLAVDIQPEMLEKLEAGEAQRGLTNVQPVLGAIDDPKLPTGEVDLVLMVDAYHEFSHPKEMMDGIVKGLKPGGRVALVEYRGEDDTINIKPLHKMTQAQAKKEMAAAGLKFVENLDVLPTQHLMIFEKPKAASTSATKSATE